MPFKKFLISLIMIIGLLLLNVMVSYGFSYYVQPGDSLYTIAARYGTTVSSLMQTNGLWSPGISPGQALKITSGSSSSTASSVYNVRPGDTLYLIAQRYGVSIDTIKQTNHLSSVYLNVGERILIPNVTSGSSSGNNYQVKAGDTLFLIAKRNGIALNQLLQANHLNQNTAIYPGQVLQIPVVTNTGFSANHISLSQSDLDLLARLVTAESDGEPYEGQVAVAATILNRLSDPRYPKTVPGIIYQIDNGIYQYSPVLDGRINNPASSNAYRAVNDALSGWDPSKGANGFYNPAKTTSQWVRSQPVSAAIGNHVFFDY